MATTDTKLLAHVKGGLLAVYRSLLRRQEDARRQVEAKADFSTVGDSVSSQALVEYYRNSGLAAILSTEELDAPIRFSPNPEYAVIADDLDGTRNQATGFGMLPHGPIVGIADKSDPTFDDVVASGFLELKSGNLFYSVRNGGAHLIEGWARGGEIIQDLRTSGATSMESMKTIVVCNYMLGELAAHFAPLVARQGVDYFSTAVHLALLAAGSVDLFVDGDNCLNPRKRCTGEEIGPLYRLVKEAGGAGIDWAGRDLGPQKIGLAERKTFHYVVAATPQLAEKFVHANIRNNEAIAAYMQRKNLL